MKRKILLFLLVAAAIFLAQPPRLGNAQDQNQAALVVRFGEGNVTARCVSFDEAQISGYELLTRSGLPVELDAQGLGALVCRIGDTGCPADNCLCQCSGGGDCRYWSYWQRNGGGWHYSQIGASNRTLSDGDIDGWSWGPGNVNEAIAPPNLTFADVCQAASPPTATAVPPTSTPLPTATAIPATATAVPPTATATTAPEIAFRAEATQITAGECTTLHWNVEHIQAVYLDGAGVTGQGNQRVCPTQTHTYTLRIVHAAGETDRQVTVEVAAAAAPTNTAAPQPQATQQTIADAAPATATAVPATATPIPPQETAVSAAPPSPPPTLTPAATATILWIAVPTETAAATAAPPASATPAALAALPAAAPQATNVSAAVSAAPLPAASGGAASAAPLDWRPYAVFLLIVAFFSGVLVGVRADAPSR